jgi:hypothetical protein
VLDLVQASLSKKDINDSESNSTTPVKFSNNEKKYSEEEK